MDFHPIANIFPMLSDAELEVLAADIRAVGLRDSITTCEGKILDGRNRYAACAIADIEPRFEEYTGSDPLSFVVSKNLHRRHLTREQRDEVIRNLRAQGMTLQKIADAVGVNVATAHRATHDDSAFANAKAEVIGADGKHYPTAYAPRQEPESDDDGEDGDGLDEYEFNRQQILEANRAGFCIEAPGNLPHVANNSGDNEWYTPPEYIEAVRQVLGNIDLDPASSESANETIRAETFYSMADDGLAHEWSGRVFMNPPYASSLIKQFASKLVKHVERKDVPAAIVLVNNATETEWFGQMIDVASAVVFPRARVKFLKDDGERGAPLQGQAVIYVGDSPEKFIAEFSKFGWAAVVNGN